MGAALSAVGGFCVRFRWPVLAVWLVLAIGLTLFTTSVPTTTDNDVSLPGTGSQAAADLLQQEFPPQQNGSSPAVYHVATGKLNDKGPNQKAITDAYKTLKQTPGVHSVTNPFAQPQAGLVSKDGTYAFMPIVLSIPGNDLSVHKARSLYDLAVQPAHAQGIEAAVGGPIGSTMQVVDTSTSERVGMLAAALILLLTFGSLIAMGMPLISAVVGLLLGLASIWFLGIVLDIPSVGATLARMIGLGVGIDYALFLVNRHRRNVIERGMDPHRAAQHATATSGGAIIFAGGTVVIALVSLQVAGIPFIAGLGYACAAAVATAVLAAVTLLPALLAIVGSGINRLRVPFIGRRTDHPLARRWAGFVTRHPIVSALLAIALLAPLIVPVRSLSLGQEDVAVSPVGTSERQAFDLMTAGFGPGYNGPLVVATSLTPKATPSDTYDQEYDEATSLQQQLEQEQKTLTQQQAELEDQQAMLEAEADELDAEAAGLEAEQAVLETEAEQLQAQRTAVESEAAELRNEAERLVARAEDLVAKERKLLKELRRTRMSIRELDRRIEKARDPVVKAELTERLERRERQQKKQRKELQRNNEELRDLRPRAERLRTQADELARQAEELAAAGAELARQAAGLEQQAAQLQDEQAALEEQAASLQAWGEELQQQADEAKQQQKQAEQLQQELTQELTKAGGDPRGTDPRIVKLQNALATPAGVALVTPPQINKPGTAVIMSVIATTRPADPATAALVETLRVQTIPPATSPGMQVDVGGSTASNVDLATLIGDRLPLVIATVVLLSSLLLLLAFRSLLVPVQAAIANVLAAAAAFGVVTAVFQWGWGLSAIGLDTPYGSVPVISYVPLMMFAALFGLSMDYQVFVMSTIQAEIAAGHPAREAVREGLAVAGRVIVTAALIMMSVFGSFVLNDDSVIKQFGVGLTVAVALAAFLVLLLAPALLTLFGSATWKLPRFLRWLPDLDLEGRRLDERWARAAAAEVPAGAVGTPDDRPTAE